MLGWLQSLKQFFKDWSQSRAMPAWILVLIDCNTFGSARVIRVFIASANIEHSDETARLRRLTSAVAARIKTIDPNMEAQIKYI